uniref:Uncharacterized protein n=1 Tax=Acrobeloides nanus TaxID=290746 RepID=A0A914DXK9_9BILA
MINHMRIPNITIENMNTSQEMATSNYKTCNDSKQAYIASEEICVANLNNDNTKWDDGGYRYLRDSYFYTCKECDEQGDALQCSKLNERKYAVYECCPGQFCSLKREKNYRRIYDYYYQDCRKCPGGEEMHECQDKRVKCCSSEFCSYDYDNEINICKPKCKEEGHHQCPDKKLSCCNTDRCVFDYGVNHFVCQKKNKKPS